ncbi:MAG: ISAs1 family transposase [Simkaniaceae bacterium]
MDKKRPAPKHIQKCTGNHPRPDLKLIQTLDSVTDPRGASCNFKHPLTTILFITIVCSLCGADDWEAIVLQANSMSDWLAQYVDMTNGVPCVKTFKRVFATLDPDGLEKIQRTLTELIKEKKSGEVVSFDGKTMRGTSCSEKDLKAIHMLNAWSHDNGICIGHRAPDIKIIILAS